MFKVLSIDGGGIRGIIPAIILAEIEKRTGQPISNLFDLIAGTSTGGILALGLTKPNQNQPETPQYSAKDLVEMYEKRGKDIFYEPWIERLSGLDDLLHPKFQDNGRDEVLTEYLEEICLEKALTEVFLTSYDTELRTPIFFTSNTNKEQNTGIFRKLCSGFTMKQAAMATSAAPTYFKPYQAKRKRMHSGMNDYYSLVDGGVFANNPTCLALMEATISSPKSKLNEILIVSLGTGGLTRKYPYEQVKKWGLLDWVRPLFNITQDGQSETVAVLLEQLLPQNQEQRKKQYYRFQANLDLGKGLDDMDDVSPENIRQLKALAAEIIQHEEKTLDQLCQQLEQPSKNNSMLLEVALVGAVVGSLVSLGTSLIH